MCWEPKHLNKRMYGLLYWSSLSVFTTHPGGVVTSLQTPKMSQGFI